METLILVVDVLLVAGASAGFALTRRLGRVAAPDIRSAFALLDRSIQKRYPGIPPGYTWSEAFEWLKGKGVQADWPRLQTCLSEYEAFRYGQKQLDTGGCQRDIAALAMRVGGELRR